MADSEPNLHNSIISRVLGQRWQQMSSSERQPFVREADRVRQLHLKEHPDYRYCPRRKEKRKLGERRGYIRHQMLNTATRESCQPRQSVPVNTAIDKSPAVDQPSGEHMLHSNFYSNNFAEVQVLIYYSVTVTKFIK